MHHLHINVKKQEEINKNLKSVGDLTHINIHGNAIRQLIMYKYLGVQIHNALTWNIHVKSVCVRVHQQLHFHWRLSFWGLLQHCVNFFIELLQSLS